jgi:hypothetical protein
MVRLEIDWDAPPQATVAAVRHAVAGAALRAGASPDTDAGLAAIEGMCCQVLEQLLPYAIEKNQHLRGACTCAHPTEPDRSLQRLALPLGPVQGTAGGCDTTVACIVDETGTVQRIWLQGMLLDAQAFLSPAVLQVLNAQAQRRQARAAAVVGNVITAIKVGL